MALARTPLARLTLGEIRFRSGLSQIGAIGFEPATARPPSGQPVGVDASRSVPCVPIRGTRRKHRTQQPVLKRYQRAGIRAYMRRARVDGLGPGAAAAM